MNHFWKLSLLATAVLSCALPTMPMMQPAQASTALPMTLTTGEGMFTITVPNSNTTESAYGGRLRVYDVHIAKMFEVTHHMCSSGRLSPGASWSYYADSGSVNMGNFYISCQLARDIAIAYGLGNSEATTLYVSQEESGRTARNMSVPILNIIGGKVDSWMQFTSQFTPN